MTTNVSYEFANAEKEYHRSTTLEEKIEALKKMISAAPAHKGGESLRADLRSRLKKFTEKQEKNKKTGKSTRKIIKKEGFQIVLVGLTNAGKSSLVSKLTNAHPRVDSYQFTTKIAEVGTMHYQGIQCQIIDLPSIGSENFDLGIVHTADLALIVIENLADLKEISPILAKATEKRIIVINKCDLYSADQLRKLEETIKSKKLPGIIISCYTGHNLSALKEKIISMTGMIRIYTKEPGKPKSNNPIALPLQSTVKDVAESIRKGFYLTVKESKVTGPSSKFPNQKVGLSHVLKDLDIVEFHTR